MKVISIIILLCLLSPAYSISPQDLQDVSVSVVAGNSEGSGVVYIKDNVSYVWTAAHVLTDLDKGSYFLDAVVIKDIKEDDKKVGEVRLKAKIIKYSSFYDVALLQVIKKGYLTKSTKFYPKSDTPKVGIDLMHVGSMSGHMKGAESFSKGVLSYVNREVDGTYLDAANFVTRMGASGGGVFTEDGEYIGMLVRSDNGSRNLMVPIREIRGWAKRHNVEYALGE